MPIRSRASAPLPPCPPSAPSPGEPWREWLRRFVMAAVVGAAVIVAPGGPSPERGPNWRPPAYERALRWRDIIRLRLSPWLLSGMFGPPPDATLPPGTSPEPHRDPPGEPRSP
ncbi:MAG: hypothetical protein M3O34_08470 [Chloroflexota bacterium]|nr:hypothetical protein [Chloroflexota bacterium]